MKLNKRIASVMAALMVLSPMHSKAAGQTKALVSIQEGELNFVIEEKGGYIRIVDSRGLGTGWKISVSGNTISESH